LAPEDTCPVGRVGLRVRWKQYSCDCPSGWSRIDVVARHAGGGFEAAVVRPYHDEWVAHHAGPKGNTCPLVRDRYNQLADKLGGRGALWEDEANMDVNAGIVEAVERDSASCISSAAGA
jgi:hypothetical protein